MIKQFNRETIKVKGKEIDCLILGKYENVAVKKKYDPHFICTLGKDSYIITETTTKKKGIIYIPWKELKNHKSLKEVRGKKDNYRYNVWRNIQVSDFMVTCEVTEYDNRKEYLKTA